LGQEGHIVELYIMYFSLNNGLLYSQLPIPIKHKKEKCINIDKFSVLETSLRIQIGL